ncbi:MAG: ATP-binding protein [Chromatiales bacterium]
MSSDDRLTLFLARAEQLLERIEKLLPQAPAPTDWSAPAFRWRSENASGWLEAIHHPQVLSPDHLLCMESQKAAVIRNTERFLNGHPANNILLWGSRGTGKSSLVKALLHLYAERGLRLIEVDKDDLLQLPAIFDKIEGRPERFVLFSDDLSFEAAEPGYKQLKAALEGSLSGLPENVLIYATSNRRHLLPEYFSENRETTVVDGEIHLGDSVEEKISLSERFGLWISFYPLSQDDYLAIVEHWLQQSGQEMNQETRMLALQWATRRGSRSGRVARQFAIDLASR